MLIIESNNVIYECEENMRYDNMLFVITVTWMLHTVKKIIKL